MYVFGFPTGQRYATFGNYTKNVVAELTYKHNKNFSIFSLNQNK